MRTTFIGKQVFELEKTFESKKYLSSTERAELAASLDVTQQQVRESDKMEWPFQVLSWENMCLKVTFKCIETKRNFMKI